jgi:hypothetical protein
MPSADAGQRQHGVPMAPPPRDPALVILVVAGGGGALSTSPVDGEHGDHRIRPCLSRMEERRGVTSMGGDNHVLELSRPSVHLGGASDRFVVPRSGQLNPPPIKLLIPQNRIYSTLDRAAAQSTIAEDGRRCNLCTAY